MVIVGCSQLPTRARPPHPGSPNQVVPSTPGSPLTPVPDLGPATPALPGGPSLEGPLFPDSAAGSYVLPMKKQVRRAEGLVAGDTCEVTLEVVETEPG